MTMPPQKPGQSKQDYTTPAGFITAVEQRLGIVAFAHDYAADASNAKAKTFYNKADDALSVPHWECVPGMCNGWGWLNPPFSDIRPWAARCVETRNAGGSIALLVPASVGSNWFRDHVDGQALVLLLNGRLAFMSDKPTWLYPKDCILCLYSPTIAGGYQVWTWADSAKARKVAA